jgi:DNA-binding GntR family transcriptional regulator
VEIVPLRFPSSMCRLRRVARIEFSFQMVLMSSSANTPLRLDAVMERLTLADQVYSSIKKAIIEGDLRPGERLREVEVAASLGASRTPVREALSRLEQDGLVQSLKTGGSVVVELSISEMREIFDLIQVLETHAVRMASERITPKQLEKLDTVCSRAEQALKVDQDKVGELNRIFHELIIDAAGSQRLKLVIGNLRSSMQPYRALALQSNKFREHSVSDHRRVVNLLKLGESEKLGMLMAKHLAEAQEATLEGIEAQMERHARPLTPSKRHPV